MFRKKDEEMQVPEPEAPREETAYEDNWYRSLKAMREQQEVEPDAEEAPEVSAEPAAEAGDEALEVPEAPDDALPEELQERAGQLLERLRTLQHLGDVAPAEPEPEPEPKHSVWG